MQGSEQNMDSLPLRHRSIAICNPSPGGPPMTASRAMSSQIPSTALLETGGRSQARAGDQPGLRSLSVHPTSPSSRLRLASHLATTTGPQLALTPCHTNLMCPFRWQSHSSSSSRKRSKTTTISPPPRSFGPPPHYLHYLPSVYPPPQTILPMTDQEEERDTATQTDVTPPTQPPFIPSLTVSKTKNTTAISCNSRARWPTYSHQHHRHHHHHHPFNSPHPPPPRPPGPTLFNPPCCV